ncbi:craniofacial development protein 2-like [Acyrthosiphon pisum]|uniref:Endonuclease/exonuclease/phosphatase domain-containing protein n=1 Tax=Acyrthosiphon pisum TaxID=7029 RepID=A0A8R2B1W4_ACYPI|nr:craniofacial development protein 2-like [Acyrthosiphon pisum]XP_029340942.1 craniofacial development protein 2-like [Acyrthosiphon pisum]|eukprot:XP_008178185.1 PREDICTED: craniofacial development protein 2-like [Acyrthosiphon pisum]
MEVVVGLTTLHGKTHIVTIQPKSPRMKYVELKDFLIGTWNVRSLYRAGHLTTVISSLERYQLNIAAIQETRWPGQGNLKINNWTYFYSGGLDHQAGVGFVVNDKLLPNVKLFEAINNRICYLELKCKWYNFIIINGYAPTEDKNEAIKNEYYERLDTVWDLLPNSKVKILLGDFNAKIGQEPIFSPTIGSNSLHLNSNDNGTRLINFAMARGMVVSSTTFPHKNIHKQTWVSPDGRTRNQIDHIVVDGRFKRCIMDVRSMRGSSGISDHFMVKTKVRLRLSIKWKERRSPVKKINIEPLNYSQTSEQYKNRLNDILRPTEKASSIDEM